MPPKAQKEIVYPILSEEQFYSIVNQENKKLHGTLMLVKCVLVVDLHLSWCGPCIVMNSNYRSLFFGFEEAEKRLEFWTVSINLLNFIVRFKHPSS